MPGIREVTEALREQLAASIPQDAAVVGPATMLDAEGWITVSPPVDGAGHQLEVRVRAPGNFEVAYCAPQKQGSPFEACFIGSEADEALIRDEVVQHVRDLATEVKVVARDRRLLRRRIGFIAIASLGKPPFHHLSWVISWRGTHDWTRGESAA